ncbi:Smr/MutS family protein [Magnetovibrio sp.]|uniref:Smr/MutS family protein n=1 Tax=Magnetovibrio sp. TaxID=2024836 RepID=UPI002F9444F4
MPKSRKPRPPKKKKAETPEDDLNLWRAVAQTVEPLKGRDVPPEDFGAKPPAKCRPSLPVVRPETPPPMLRPLPELTHEDQPGLDKATAKRMRRGQVRLEGRLDLHGQTQAEAHRALDAFLDAAYMVGKREVLVITGKGTRADGSIGVLREQVPRWLSSYPNRAKVVAFSYASPKDGGVGALYVRLKKR